LKVILEECMPAFNAKYAPFAELSFDNFTLGQVKKHIVP